MQIHFQVGVTAVLVEPDLLSVGCVVLLEAELFFERVRHSVAVRVEVGRYLRFRCGILGPSSHIALGVNQAADPALGAFEGGGAIFDFIGNTHIHRITHEARACIVHHAV